MKKVLFILAGILTAGILYIDLSRDNFREKIDREVSHLSAAARGVPPRVADSEQLNGMPAPVRRYFGFALQGTRPLVTTALIKQNGDFRAGESSRWVPFQAEQHAATTIPSFVWHAHIRPTPYTWIEARDRYYDATGVMEGRLLSAVPLLFAHGKEMDISSLARFLAEAPWYPTALLPGRHLTWKARGKDAAEAVVSDGGYTASVVFTFNERGEIIRAETTDRYRNISGRMERAAWKADYREYRKMQGVMIPTEVDISWETPKGAFQYARVKVTELSYNSR